MPLRPTPSLVCAASLLGSPLLCVASDGFRTRPPADAPAGGVPRGPLARHFPNVRLKAHDGREVRFYDDLIRGKVVLINFIYTNCDGICPTSTANLARLQRLLGDRLGRDVFMISVCIDPERDTVESMKAYAEAYEARPGWTFATGTQRDVDLIRRALGVYNPDDAADRVRSNHTGMLIGVNDPAGRNINVPTALRVELLEDMVRRLAALPKLDRL